MLNGLRYWVSCNSAPMWGESAGPMTLRVDLKEYNSGPDYVERPKQGQVSAVRRPFD